MNTEYDKALMQLAETTGLLVKEIAIEAYATAACSAATMGILVEKGICTPQELEERIRINTKLGADRFNQAIDRIDQKMKEWEKHPILTGENRVAPERG